MVGVTIGTMADHPENQTGVGGTIGTLAYHPMNQIGVGGTIGTLAYHPGQWLELSRVFQTSNRSNF